MKRYSLILLLFFFCPAVWAKTIAVPSGEYPTIQSAINAADNGDEVIVSPGTYYENINFRGKAIIVRSVNPDDPSVVAATIINGSLPADPNVGSVVTFAGGEDNSSVLSGFTITGGSGSWLLVSWEYQGLRWNRCGGGAVCYHTSAPTITKNVFINNIAGQGGGIYIYGDPVNPNDPQDPPLHTSPVIADNTFMENSAIVNHGFAPPNTNYPSNDNGDGGAIVAFQGCDAAITGNLIQGNHADWYGGGIHLRQWSNGLIEDNHLIGNDSRLGAGVHITYMSAPTVRRNVVERNIAGGLGGGGIYIYYLSRPLVERNIITNNTSSNGAGVGVYYDSAPVIRNNLIYKNNSGAGVRVVGSSPSVIHNTITNNYLGGIDCDAGYSVIIEDNIITSNGNGWGIWVHGGSSLVIRYNNLWNNPLGTCGPDIPDQTGINGNISVDPKFVNPDSNDYHLDYTSTCINAGDPNYSSSNVTDYEGDSRLMGQYVDIGADEAQPVWNVTGTEQYGTIQQAVDDANGGDVIVVTVGTHTGAGNRDIDFRGKAITLQSIDPSNRAIAASTIINCEGSVSQPHRGFYFHSGEDANSIVNGLTVTGGGGTLYGAICCMFGSSPTIKNCIVKNNSMHDHGSGFYCGDNSNPIIENCIISSNTFTVVGYGGGIYCYKSSPIITNCIITNNSAVGPGRHGGGICCWGDQEAGGNALVANCIISGNSAGHRGGGLYAYWSSPTFVNCTVIGNKALEGGGIGSFRESNPEVINCIVRDNIAPDGNQLALINTTRVWGVSIPTEMTVSYSNIEGGQAEACVDHHCTLHWGSGNIDIDPNFMDGGYWDDANTPAEPNDDFFVVGDYHLLPASSCVDVGDNNSVPELSDSDIDGEQRVFNGIVDMGADEFVISPFDLNSDGIVDYFELAVLVDEWLQSGSQLQADFHKDTFVDLLDYAQLANQWLAKAHWYK